MLTELQEKKIRHLFHVFDRKGDGVLDQEEFVGLFSNSVEMIEPQKVNRQGLKIKKLQFLVWRKLQKFFNFNLDSTINQEQWITWTDYIVNNLKYNTELTQNFIRFYHAIFESLDTDKDGYLTLKDYMIWFKHFQLRGDPTAIFYRLDINRNGKISKEGFGQLALDYYLYKLEAPGNYLWGIFD